MGQKGVVFDTSLSVQQLGQTFRTAGESARGGLSRVLEAGARLAGNGDTTGYYTPNFDSPFAAIDGVPDFAIGVNILKFGGGAQGNGTHVHMYVDDRGDQRVVELFAKHGLIDGGRAGRIAQKFLESFKQADPKLKITQGNI